MGKMIIEFKGESCSWCKNEDSCRYKKRAMEATREAVKNVLHCTSAYCSGEVTCDYYTKDNDKYSKYTIGDCPQ